MPLFTHWLDVATWPCLGSGLDVAARVFTPGWLHLTTRPPATGKGNNFLWSHGPLCWGTTPTRALLLAQRSGISPDGAQETLWGGGHGTPVCRVQGKWTPGCPMAWGLPGTWSVCGPRPQGLGQGWRLCPPSLSFTAPPLCSFPCSEGSNLTPAHHFQDFRFKTYAPVAFRYFRELFGIRPDDYLVSVARQGTPWPGFSGTTPALHPGSLPAQFPEALWGPFMPTWSLAWIQSHVPGACRIYGS